MSKLKEQLQANLKDAMKNKDVFSRDNIRMIMSAIKQIEVDERKEVTDEDITKIIQKSIKQREEAAEQYKSAGREDLYQTEIKEAEFLKNYLPKQLDDGELEEAIKAIIAQTGATSMKDMGKVMQEAKAQIGSSADGKRINGVVKALLG
jgi:uncharacterized protein YqeY